MGASSYYHKLYTLFCS